MRSAMIFVIFIYFKGGDAEDIKSVVYWSISFTCLCYFFVPLMGVLLAPVSKYTNIMLDLASVLISELC